MSNHLVGDLYELIVKQVIENSRGAFEEFGAVPGTAEELQAGWQAKLSAKNTAVMPWDPKPVQQPPQPAPAPPSAVSNGLTPQSYSYDTPPPSAPSAPPKIKQESGVDSQYGGPPANYAQNGAQHQGGAARAAQLMQQQYGQAASASVNAMQRGGGLALPGGQQQGKPQLHLPAQSPPLNQQQYAQQQQQAMRQQQQYQQQQQMQPRIKQETNSPHMAQQSFPQQSIQQNYGQTDGADDGDALDQWRTLLAERRAKHAEHGEAADHLMRDTIQQHSAELQSGLMMPLDQLPSNKRLKRTVDSNANQFSQSQPSIPQLDGTLDEDEDEDKKDIKSEDDLDAINSDLDDDDDGDGALNDDDDETMDTILCTYDKVQRVKNKWKCTLKDGIMSANGKEWIFAKGMGEFEW